MTEHFLYKRHVLLSNCAGNGLKAKRKACLSAFYPTVSLSSHTPASRIWKTLRKLIVPYPSGRATLWHRRFFSPDWLEKCIRESSERDHASARFQSKHEQLERETNLIRTAFRSALKQLPIVQFALLQRNHVPETQRMEERTEECGESLPSVQRYTLSPVDLRTSIPIQKTMVLPVINYFISYIFLIWINASCGKMKRVQSTHSKCGQTFSD